MDGTLQHRNKSMLLTAAATCWLGFLIRVSDLWLEVAAVEGLPIAAAGVQPVPADPSWDHVTCHVGVG